MLIAGGAVESAVDTSGQLAALVHPVGCDFVWGLKSIVQAVSAAQLWNYRWLIEDVTPKPKNILPSPPGYSVSYCRYICTMHIVHRK